MTTVPHPPICPPRLPSPPKLGPVPPGDGKPPEGGSEEPCPPPESLRGASARPTGPDPFRLRSTCIALMPIMPPQGRWPVLAPGEDHFIIRFRRGTRMAAAQGGEAVFN